jgi:hypothetical protein
VKILYIPATAALVGLLPMDHDGYTLVRIVVCAFLIYAGLRVKTEGSPNAEKLGTEEASLIFFVIAAIYNPIFPLHLTRGLWMFIDIGVAGYLFWVVSLKSPVVESADGSLPLDSTKQLIEKSSEKADKLMSSILWSSLTCLFFILFFMVIAKG